MPMDVISFRMCSGCILRDGDFTSDAEMFQDYRVEATTSPNTNLSRRMPTFLHFLQLPPTKLVK